MYVVFYCSLVAREQQYTHRTRSYRGSSYVSYVLQMQFIIRISQETEKPRGLLIFMTRQSEPPLTSKVAMALGFNQQMI